jgi:uncharacterized membrane protein
MPVASILDAPVIIQCHLGVAIPALVLGPVVIWGRLDRGWHRRLGFTWVASMALLAGLPARPFRSAHSDVAGVFALEKDKTFD